MRGGSVFLTVIFSLMIESANPQSTRGVLNPLHEDTAAARAGKKIYEKRCQECYGGDARGGRGPALATGSFQVRADDRYLFDAIENGIPGTAMPPFETRSDTNIWQVVTYLRSLAGTVSEEVVSGDVIAGEEIFRGKGGCLSCHQVHGEGGRIGPDLSRIGKWVAQAIREVIVDPSGVQGRKPNLVVARTKNGRTIRGIRKNEDTLSIQLMDVTERFHFLRKKDLAALRYEDRSLMPDNYGQVLSKEELDNLVAYLKTLERLDLKKVVAIPLEGGLSYERIRHSHREPQNWLTYWGDYQGGHYSALNQINTGNVHKLQTRWAFQFTKGGILETTPLVVDGAMYATGPSGYVFMMDARTGRLVWEYRHRPKDPEAAIWTPVNRGVALLGPRVFLATLDARVVALDATTGRLLWETEMADPSGGYSSTMAPLALKDKIIAGISGGELGIRGFIDAYDPATGERLWRFHTIPGPGEFGHDIWEGESWKIGGGPTWMTGTYDPELDTLYWGIGNPAPDFDGDVRKGDNLFTCSVVALDASTGQLKWHFQFTPHDTHDWDANETPVLIDRSFRGRSRKLLLQANRNAFFYVLDRVSGDFLLGAPFARQTWAKGLDSQGRPILMPDSEASEEGVLHYPAGAGATNWQAPSYDPDTGWLYITFREASDRYFKEPQEYERGQAYWGGKAVAGEEPEWGGIKALNPESGKTEWEYKYHLGTWSAGVLATAGGVVFSGSREGNLMTFDSRTGKLLGSFQTGGQIDSSPISYAVDGRQYVALAAGTVLYSFALPDDPED